MIKIYRTHVTIYLGLVGPMGKRGCLSTFMVHLGLMGMGVSLPPCCDPYLDFGPFGSSALVVCGTMNNFGMMT